MVHISFTGEFPVNEIWAGIFRVTTHSGAEFNMQTYKKKIFVETAYLGANVSCVVTEKGLVLIDSPFLPGDAMEWAGRVRKQTGKKIAYQINTDHHFDHVLGNAFTTERVICHERAARGIEFLKDRDSLMKIINGTFPVSRDLFADDIKTLEIPSAHLTFKEVLTINMGDTTFLLEFVGGHSPGTILVYVPEYRALFTGDNVEAQFPFFGESRFSVWMGVLKKLLTMDIDLVVPGHGAVGGKELIENYLSFFQGMEEEVKAFKSEGLSIDQMIKKSTVIDYFQMNESEQDSMPRSWIELQYRTASEQILAVP
jgi:cyclase